MADKVWVQNAYRSAIEIIVKDEKNLEDKHFIFNNYKIDRVTGRVADDGYTVLSNEGYKMLCEKSGTFKKLTGNNTLIISTEAPLSAMSDVDRILMLQEEIRTLKAEKASLQEELDKVKGSKKSETKSEAKSEAKASDKKSDK